MNENYHPFYKHSGKFGVHGPLLVILATVMVGYPLGILYAYLLKWIPFIYLHVFFTAGYGVAFGFLAYPLLKFAHVRNNIVALATGIVCGMSALYLAWNGFLHAMIDGAPVLITPRQLIDLMKILYETGSWSVGRSNPTPVTGVLLAIVWAVEGLLIVGLCTLATWAPLASLPFCERHQCWLDKDKVIDKLDAFVMPDQLAALAAGNIAPLEQARPRVPASGAFARLTLKYSDKCDDYCSLTIENVTVELDKNGKQKEQKKPILTNLLVPKTMFDYLAQFDRISARPPAVPTV